MDLAELPGSESILAGLDDLKKGKTQSIGALLIAVRSSSPSGNRFYPSEESRARDSRG
jgi:hypothetical protein